jgi:hypothetical protein
MSIKTGAELLAFHEVVTKRCRAVMERKNHDYTAGAGARRPFANFELSALVGLCSAEEGLLLRVLDKVQRLLTYLKCGTLKVTNESMADACEDIINYMVILEAMTQEREEDAPH